MNREFKPLFELHSENEEIVFRAAEMKSFKDAILGAKDKIEAIKTVRVLLPKYFSEIKRQPQEDQNDFQTNVSIAKGIVDLLWYNEK